MTAELRARVRLWSRLRIASWLVGVGAVMAVVPVLVIGWEELALCLVGLGAALTYFGHVCQVRVLYYDQQADRIVSRIGEL